MNAAAFAYIAQPLYGLPRAASVSGPATALTLMVVYLTAPHNRPRDDVENATVVNALRVAAAGLAGAVLLPALQLAFVIALGIDGP